MSRDECGRGTWQALRTLPARHYAVVPYGCGVSFDGLKNKPVKGRVLVCGTADLRKGIHYLGMAAKAARQ